MTNPSANNIIITHNFARVSRRNPCPVCGKPDWCMCSLDGKIVICARVQSDKLAGQAGWLHNIITRPTFVPQTKVVKQSTNKASLEVVTIAYEALFGILTLSPEHLNNLISRGLTREQIKSLGYKTLPIMGRSYLIKQLKGINLDGVPGFWKDDFSWNHNPYKYRLAGQSGILLPIRNLNRQITGCQIRCDGLSTSKYKWLSSADKPNGCSSGVSVHVAQTAQTDRSEVWITEGPLKADIISLKLKRIVLAIPGVACWNKVIPVIWQLKPESVIVALDMDKLTNLTVMAYRNLLINKLLIMGVEVFEANWNPKFKGLDDLLADGELK